MFKGNQVFPVIVLQGELFRDWLVWMSTLEKEGGETGHEECALF
jgi:hypothetical protein